MDTNEGFGILDDIFEEDWKEFIQEVQRKNRESNYRLLTVIKKVKGKEYLNSLKAIMKKVGTGALLRFTNERKGVPFTQKRWEGVGEVYVDQYSSAEGMVCDLYIQVKEGKYLTLKKHL